MKIKNVGGKTGKPALQNCFARKQSVLRVLSEDLLLQSYHYLFLTCQSMKYLFKSKTSMP